MDIHITSNWGAKRYLRGRTIVAVEMNPAPTGNPESPHTSDPVFRFDDGSSIRFEVAEMEDGDHGIDVVRERGT